MMNCAAPSRPPPVALAVPSVAHLRFHEDNIGAISHFGMQVGVLSVNMTILQ